MNELRDTLVGDALRRLDLPDHGPDFWGRLESPAGRRRWTLHRPTGVHFAVDGPQLELDPDHAPASGTTLASPLELVVGEVVDAWVWIDGAEPRPLTERGQVSIDLETAAGPGTHLVTLVVAEGDAITARSYTVMVP